MSKPESKIPKRHKYGAKKTVVDGLTFDSKGEARRWLELQVLLRTGQIRDLVRQLPYPLESKAGEKILTRTGRVMRYVADFVYRDGAGRVIVEDFKGMDTEASAIKRAVVEAFYDIKIQIIRGRS